MKTDPQGIEIVPGSFTACECGGMKPSGTCKLMIPMPPETQSLEGEHDALMICPACGKKIQCRVKIDLRRHLRN